LHFVITIPSDLLSQFHQTNISYKCCEQVCCDRPAPALGFSGQSHYKNGSCFSVFFIDRSQDIDDLYRSIRRALFNAGRGQSIQGADSGGFSSLYLARQKEVDPLFGIIGQHFLYALFSTDNQWDRQ